MAHTIYFVDPVGGDNANDGLTTATALADIFKVMDVTNHVDASEFWVRRGTEIVFSETKLMPFAQVFGWPNEGDFGYDTRPEDGRASWDADVIDSAVIKATGDFYIDVKGADADIKFCNIKFLDEGIGALQYIQASYGNLVFENCDISWSRTGDRRHSGFCQVSKSGDEPTSYEIEVLFNNCNISSDTETSVIFIDPSYANYTKRFIFRDTIANLYILANFEDGGGDQYLGSCYLDIIDSEITVDFTVFKHLAYGGASYGYYYVDFLRSKFYSQRSVLEGTDANTNNYDSLSIWNIKSEACTYNVSGYLFEISPASTAPSYIPQLTGFYFVDNIVEYGASVLYFYPKYSYANNRPQIAGPTYFKGNYFDLTSSVIKVYKNASYIYWNSTISFINNEYANVTSLFYTNAALTGSVQKLTVVEENMSLSSDLQNTTMLKTEIMLTSCNINGKLGAFNKGRATLLLSNIHGIDASIDLDMRYSTITGNPAIQQVTSALIKNSIIESPTVPINSISGSATFIDCEITNDFSQPIVGNVQAYNCVVNGVTNAYTSNKEGQLRNVSGVYRQGGSNGSVVTDGELGVDMSILFDNLSGIIEAGKSAATIYFVTPNDIIGDDIQASVKVTLEIDGVPSYRNLTIEEDTESTWDGLVADMHKYKATLDLSEINYTADTAYTFYVVFFLEIGKSKQVYFDLDTQFSV